MTTDQLLRLIAAIAVLLWLAYSVLKVTRSEGCSERHFVNKLRDEATWRPGVEARQIQREVLEELRKRQEPPR